MDKSILLQKTIRDNNEDLQNFVRDLNHWENDMKRKDAELSTNKGDEEILPPIRAKSQKVLKSTSKNIDKKPEKPKRISSYDYGSWDKFDVDKACEDVDKHKHENKKESSSESDAQQEMLRNVQQALYEKELGNKYVKKEDWEKAIEQYTKAIQCYNKDAVFFANRALCYLKTNKLIAAERDCTKSLELDSQYVKAYQRRAAARIGLKKCKDAQSDLNNVIRLEPNNIQAKRDLEKLKKETESPKKQTESTKVKSGSEKPVSNNSDLSGAPKNEVKISSDVKNLDLDKNEAVPAKEIEYQWGPVDGKKIIKAINKPPHLRSKKPLKRVNIFDVDDTSQVHQCVKESKPVTKLIEQLSPKDTSNNSRDDTKVQDTFPNKKERNERTNIILKATDNSLVKPIQENSFTVDLPPPPRTSVQFSVAWKKLKSDPMALYLYLKNISGSNFPSIFKDSMESDLFSEVINTLATYFIKHHTPVLSYIEGLINVRRFSMLVLFMNEKDIKGVKQLIDYCVSNEEITKDYALELKKDFQLV